MALVYPFLGHNRVLVGAPGSVGIGDCPVYKGDNSSEFLSCWKLTPEERELVAKTGEVWLSVMSGERMPPILITAEPMMQSKNPLTGEPQTYYSDGTHMVLVAMELAMQAHEGQNYNQTYPPEVEGGEPIVRELPYTYHLGKVVNVIDEFKEVLGLTWEYLAAAWLHDIVEDCWEDMPYLEKLDIVRTLFGDLVANLVWACTGQSHINGEFQNRAARGAEQAEKITKFPLAAILKMADRIANMEASLEFLNTSKGGMYVRESDKFFDKIGVLAPEPLQQRYKEVVAALSDAFPKAVKK